MPFLNFLNEGLFYTYLNSLPSAKFWYVFFIILSAVCGYLLGSINTSILISKLFYHEDIRKFGSGNAGMTNMLRTYGIGAAAGTFIGDLLKTVIAVSIPGIIFGFQFVGKTESGQILYVGASLSTFCYLAGLCAVIGHIFPIYHKFKGGKGVMTLMTTAILLSHGPMVPLFCLFLIMLFAFRYMSLASVTLSILYPVAISAWFSIFFGGVDPIIAASAIAIAILVVWSHRGNLQRIANRTERKVTFGKRKRADAVKEAEELNEGTENDE